MPSYHHITDETGMVFMIEPLLLLGVHAMDEDHQKLFKIINDLNNHKLTDDEKAVLFNSLIEYTLNHFSVENSIFEKTNYPDAEHHKAQHEKILAALRAFDPVKTSMSEILKFLVDWLNFHILQEDKKFADFEKTLT